MEITKKEIEEKAFEWSVDYKPWDSKLPPQDYAQYGYRTGYLQAMEDNKPIPENKEIYIHYWCGDNKEWDKVLNTSHKKRLPYSNDKLMSIIETIVSSGLHVMCYANDDTYTVMVDNGRFRQR